MGITIGSLDLDDAFADLEDRDVKRSAAEVIHGDSLVFSLVETVSERGCRGLVDNALHFEAGNLSGVFGGLALRIIEVGRDRDDGFRDFLTKIVFGSLLQLLQNQCRDLGRGVFLPLREYGNVVALAHDFVGHHLYFFADFVVAASHETLDRVDRVFGIGDRLALGDLPDEPLAGLGKSDHRRGRAPSFFIGNNLGFATLHDGYAGVGGAEVNSYNLAHKPLPS